jgi:hypothetical protein
MRAFLFAGLACAAIVAGSGTAAAQSGPNQYATVSGSACKPTRDNTNPDFVSKATGGRNESTTTETFVICPLMISASPLEGSAVSLINLSMYSLDGASHDVACTAVVGSMSRTVPLTYATKVVTLPEDGSDNTAIWTAADFGGTAGTGIRGSAWTTVTCLLPPQSAISLLYAEYKPDIISQ